MTSALGGHKEMPREISQVCSLGLEGEKWKELDDFEVVFLFHLYPTERFESTILHLVRQKWSNFSIGILPEITEISFQSLQEQY